MCAHECPLAIEKMPHARARAVMGSQRLLLWDILRESGITDHPLLACVKDEGFLRMVGSSYIEVAKREKDIGKQVLKVKLFNITAVGLPTPPHPKSKSFFQFLRLPHSWRKNRLSYPRRTPPLRVEKVPMNPVHLDLS